MENKGINGREKDKTKRKVLMEEKEINGRERD